MTRVLRVLACFLAFGAHAALAQERPVVLKPTTILDGQGHVRHNTILVIEGQQISRI